MNERRIRPRRTPAVAVVLALLLSAAPAVARAQAVATTPADGSASAAAELATTADTPAEPAPGPSDGAAEPASDPAPAGDAPADVAPPAEPPAATPPAPRPPPYSVPFFLRPMPAINVVRLDTVFSPHDRVGASMMVPNSGLALDVVQIATVGIRLADWAQVIARMGWDWTSDPGWAGVSNLILASNFTWRIESVFRLAIFAALELPTGTDGTGSQVHSNARMSRLAMDNAMFVVDHMGGIVGAGFAYIDHGLTIQLDATLLAFGRVEGMGDEGLVNSTFGLLVGYFIIPELSVAGELHHQHFVSDPGAVVANPELRSQTSGTLGVRFHIQPVAGVWSRPAVSWSAGFDPPLSADAWQMFQLDIPVFF